MKYKKLIASLFIASFIGGGCKDSFSPYGVYEPKLVVYAILGSNSDTQYVKVNGTVDPHSFDPHHQFISNDVTDAVVVIQQGGLLYPFHDTTIVAIDSSGTSIPSHVYVNYSLPIVPMKEYTLSVSSPSYPSVSSTITALEKGTEQSATPIALLIPASQEFITYDVTVGNNVKAFLVTLTIEYSLFRNGIWELGQKEIPSYVELNASDEITTEVFPPIMYRGGSDGVITTNASTVSFPSNGYRSILYGLQNKFGMANIKFSRAFFTLYQFDSETYAYYSTANGFIGGSTIRLDEPDYTNIQSGYGIFGTMTQQIKSFSLPQNFE